MLKVFKYHERVRVVRRGKPVAYGRVYSQYFNRGKRLVCVELASGVGIGFPVDQVRKI